jgi:NAD(P)-dependent dehydrogenase (short-subunit alcohol dehydrogenase family)
MRIIDMDLGIKNKVALVTGGSRGIGYEVVVGLLEEGAKVVFCSSNASDIDNVTAALNQHYPDMVLGVCADLSKEGDRTRLVAKAKDRFGSIDILVNNAAIVGRTVPATELSISEWRQVFELNFFAAVDLCAQVIPGMKEKRWGRIINISSENGEQPDPNMPHYNATKAALNNLSKTLSGSYGDANILVNTVAPAFIKTPMAEEVLTGYSAENKVGFDEGVEMFLKANRPGLVLKRFGTPGEVASAVLFLASTHASYVTGSVLRVDGGSVMSV